MRQWPNPGPWPSAYDRASLDDFIGQDEAVEQGTLLREAIGQDRLFLIILWGPRGCGKTTLARITARETRSHFIRPSNGGKPIFVN